MLKHLLVFLGLLLSIRGSTQIYVDPAVAGATAAHSAIINSQLEKTNERLTLIQKAQLAVTGQLVIVNELQSNIYKGLSEVAAVMRNLLAVKDIAEASADIISNAEKALALGREDPLLLLFAEEGAREFKRRGTALAAEVGSFALTGGKNNLMDSGERSRVLNKISRELMILRGVAYGMQRTMYWAKRRGIWNSINPYARYINMDKNLADNILRNSKLLKR
ncbi:hypothetical protein [Pedobacter sp. SYSU D00535]|uniref:hypothetical protein n=1 Tax=Pedobacter sp. SYSU D00535 TaxID=2810308 RepID=UPI001A956DD5|nr:hypothetical protein [Pedobacter sp. SYSU D00535]